MDAARKLTSARRLVATAILLLVTACLPPLSKADDELLCHDLTLVFPAKAAVSATWVLPPTPRDQAPKVLFDVDSTGRPVFCTDKFTVIHPLEERMVTVGGFEPKGLAVLSDGLCLFAVGRQLGTLAEPEKKELDEHGVPKGAFQPLVTMPLREIALLARAGCSVYCAGPKEESDGWAVHTLGRSPEGALMETRLLAETKAPIDAMTADGRAVHLAVAGRVLRLDLETDEMTTVPGVPAGRIKGLATSPAGLLVDVENATHLVTKGGSFEILRSAKDGHRTLSRGDFVYLLLNRSLGVVALRGLADLTRFDLADLHPAPREPAVQVEKLRFFESGPPPYTKIQTAGSFDGSKIRRIAAQITLRRPNTGKGDDEHELTATWISPMNRTLLSGTQAIVFPRGKTSCQLYPSIGGETDERYRFRIRRGSWNLIPGKDALGARYPGTYRLSLSVDGIPCGDHAFTIEGTPTVELAITVDDLPALNRILRKEGLAGAQRGIALPLLHYAVSFGTAGAVALLLDAGADPNQKDMDGETPLFRTLMGSSWKEKAELLLRKGANIDATNRMGSTILTQNQFFPERAIFYIRHGANPNAKGHGSQSFLESIVRIANWRTDEAIDTLRARKVDLPKIFSWGNNMLGSAISDPDPAGVALLLRKGFPTTLARAKKSEPERSALYVALDEYDGAPPEKKADARRVVQILLDHGAKLVKGMRRAELMTSPDRPTTWEGRERQYMEQRDRVLFTEARILFRGDNPSFFTPTQILRFLEEDDGALDAATSSQATGPYRDAIIRAHLGRIRELVAVSTDKREVGFALNHAEAALKLAEGSPTPPPELHLICGLLFDEWGDKAKAKTHLDRWLAANPRAPQAGLVRRLLRDLAR